VAVDLARRTGLAAENGRLYRAAQAATRARDNVLGIVAHDLRSPLATAQIGADLLARHVPEDRREQSRRVAETVRRSIGLATRLVQDLLDVARIESGRLELDVKLTSPAELVHHALDLYRPMANAALIRLEGEVSGDVPAVVADSDRIQQVLSNLLDNALKFTPAGGLVRIVAQREGHEIRFDVTDTGTGIPAGQLPHVFDRFWQATPKERLGSGLGLTIAKGVVEALGGRIWVESRPGEGTTFFFTLPLASSVQTQ